MRQQAGLLAGLALVLLAPLADAAEGGGREVRIVDDGIPGSLTGRPGDPAAGRRIVTGRQVGLCLLCHSGPFPEERFQGTIGPDLAGVGARLSEAQMRLRIVDSSKLNPESVMPAYHSTERLNRVGSAWQGKTILDVDQIEDVVAFLRTLNHE